MKLYLTLVSEDGKQTLERVMFVDKSTIGRHDIYGEMVEEMYGMLSAVEMNNIIFKSTLKTEVYPTPLEVDLSPDDEVYKPSN